MQINNLFRHQECQYYFYMLKFRRLNRLRMYCIGHKTVHLHFFGKDQVAVCLVKQMPHEITVSVKQGHKTITQDADAKDKSMSNSMYIISLQDGQKQAERPVMIWLQQVMTNIGIQLSMVKCRLVTELQRHRSFRAAVAVG